MDSNDTFEKSINKITDALTVLNIMKDLDFYNYEVANRMFSIIGDETKMMQKIVAYNVVNLKIED